MGTPNAISEAAICNAALARVGSTQGIQTLADGSNESSQCAIWYPQLRDAGLADFPWPWAKGEQALAQVAGPESTGVRARAEWSRSYRYPADCLKARALLDTPSPADLPHYNQPWLRAATNPHPISFDVGQDDTGRLILTDAYGRWGYGLTCLYTRAVSDPTQFSPDFADALAWRLAIDLAQSLAFDEKKRSAAETGYERTIRKARATAMNETQSDVSQIGYRARTVRARWGG